MSVLAALAVPAFLVGAALAGPAPGPAGASPDVAGGRGAQDSMRADTDRPSPISDRQAAPKRLVPAQTPGPSRRAAALAVAVTPLDPPPSVGAPVRFRVRWSDGAGRFAGMAEDWDDGTATSSAEPVSCTGRPGAHTGALTTRHKFVAEGRYQVRFTVTSVDCAGRREARTVTATVVVSDPAEPDDTASTPATSASGSTPGVGPLPSLVPSVPAVDGSTPSTSVTPATS